MTAPRPTPALRPHEHEIHYADLTIPTPGELTELQAGSHSRGGVWWLRMPLPFALDHINLWLVEDEAEGRRGFTAIDTGVSTPETMAHWQTIRGSYFKGLPILRVICTHMHPDHMGLAYWLCGDECEAPLWMTLGEYTTGRMFASRCLADEDLAQPDGPAATMAEHFRRHGMHSPDDYQKVLNRKGHFSSLVPRVPMRYRRLMPEEAFEMGGETWRVIPGYGHSPEHASLYCQASNLLISGDMLLPRISTNMSVWAHEPDADPLGQYLASIERFSPLPENTLVLPSHGRPFGGPEMTGAKGGIHTRLRQLRAHHEERLAEALEACKAPKTCAQVLPVLFPRELDFHQFTFAMGETIAHMNRLWHAGRVSRVQHEGAYRFEAV